MDDPQVAREPSLPSNIDFDRLFARAQQPDVKDRLLELTQDAVDRGVFGCRPSSLARKCILAKTSCATWSRRSSRLRPRANDDNASLKGAIKEAGPEEYVMTTALDAMSAADILAGLPNRISKSSPPILLTGQTIRLSSKVAASGVISIRNRRRRSRRRLGAPADTAWRSRGPGKREFRGSCSLIFACSELDAWPVVVNPRLSARELDQIYTHSGARRMLITTESQRKPPLTLSRLGAHLHQIGPFGWYRCQCAQPIVGARAG